MPRIAAYSSRKSWRINASAVTFAGSSSAYLYAYHRIASSFPRTPRRDGAVRIALRSNVRVTPVHRRVLLPTLPVPAVAGAMGCLLHAEAYYYCRIPATLPYRCARRAATKHRRMHAAALCSCLDPLMRWRRRPLCRCAAARLIVPVSSRAMPALRVAAVQAVPIINLRAGIPRLVEQRASFRAYVRHHCYSAYAISAYRSYLLRLRASRGDHLAVKRSNAYRRVCLGVLFHIIIRILYAYGVRMRYTRATPRIYRGNTARASLCRARLNQARTRAFAALLRDASRALAACCQTSRRLCACVRTPATRPAYASAFRMISRADTGAVRCCAVTSPRAITAFIFCICLHCDARYRAAPVVPHHALSRATHIVRTALLARLRAHLPLV